MHYFDPRVPKIKHVRYEKNTYFLSSMDSALFDVNDHVAEHAVVYQISSPLSCDNVGF